MYNSKNWRASHMRFVLIATAMILFVSIPIDSNYTSVILDSEENTLPSHGGGSTVANVIVMDSENIELTGTKNVSGHDWDVYRVIIGEESTYTTVSFEAGHSYGNSSVCLLYTSPSPRDATLSRMPSSA